MTPAAFTDKLWCHQDEDDWKSTPERILSLVVIFPALT